MQWEYMENILKNICAREKIEFLCYIVGCDTKSVEALWNSLLFPSHTHMLPVSLPLSADIAQYAKHF